MYGARPSQTVNSSKALSSTHSATSRAVWSLVFTTSNYTLGDPVWESSVVSNYAGLQGVQG